MRLLIISNMSHYRSPGGLVGWGPTVQEIDRLATLFDEIVHLGCIHQEAPPASSLPYRARNLQLRLVPAAGGRGLAAKLDVLRRIPGWAATIRRSLREADAVQIRCPANISLIALLMLFVSQRPRARWVKYAGNWRPENSDPLSYRVQRWLLRQTGHRAVVTVNGRWPDERHHVVSFVNPCLTESELVQGREIAAAKTLQQPIRLCFVGRIEPEKGAERTLRILRQLHATGLSSIVTFVGGGVYLPRIAERATAWGLEASVRFAGWVPRSELPDILAETHFLLLPTSASEGFPKALAEGMAFGAVPVAGAVSSIPQVLGETGAGVAVDPWDESGFVDAIRSYVLDTDLWTEAVENGLAAARRFTYDAFLDDVVQLFETKLESRLSRDRPAATGEQ